MRGHFIYLRGHRVELSQSVNDSFRNRAPGTPGGSETLIGGRFLGAPAARGMAASCLKPGGVDLLPFSFCSFLTSVTTQI